MDGRQGQISEQIKEITNHKGVDVAFEVSGSYAALHEAIRSVVYSGKIISQGFYQGGGQSLILGEEFHHNRINVICSQISGVSPELSNRWNIERMVRRGIELQAEGVLNFRPLITHQFPLEQVAEAYQLLDEHSDQVLQVVIDFTQDGSKHD